ncbi:protein translocase subunit SecF [Thermococcus argininiproducens]|uniref:Protein-export membrane protein SecF n=1 Tax=Thermococcus argininiproducens TaxID=2866384 RepID=A0A9E7MAM4_9EURY|nr:protein translocase subunit SecF [Thermococcus argininiproducens]USH00254.1 protein translocase subunit SecF [Thermococcus argininiproducens]
MLENTLKKLAATDPKKMITYPLIVFLVAVLILAVHFPNLGIDLGGGVAITIYGVDASASEVEVFLKQNNFDVTARAIIDPTGKTKIEIRAPLDTDPLEIMSILRSEYPNAEMHPVKVGAAISKTAQHQGLKAVILAFIGMAIIVFIFFRDPIPSLTVVFSALSDMTIALALMSIFGLELRQATIAALLLLIGYSVDSNILLTTKLLRRKEDTIEDAYFSAVSTGFTMSTTTLGALASLWLLSQAEVIDMIASVLIFGLLADFMNTWILNAGVLRWYIYRGEKK